MSTSQRHVVRWTTALLLSAVLLAGATWAVPNASHARPAGTHPLSSDDGEPADYCAIMPDSVGLYVGNPVTQMGFQIGKVTAIAPSNLNVRVDFSITAHRALPADVQAVTRSTSVLTDRSLELVGNVGSGSRLSPGDCIPLTRSHTPKSLSEVVMSATNWLNAVNPPGSTNIGGVVNGLDRTLRNNGAGIRELLATSSQVLDSPDQAIGDLGTIITNLAQLTSALVEIRGPLKSALLDAQQTTPDITTALNGSVHIFEGVVPLIFLVGDIERELGPREIQETLDVSENAIQKLAQHATAVATLTKFFPVVLNWIERHVQNHQFNTIRYRPPLYRIRTPDGLLTCGFMNASAPGSCADVAGTPYSVDIDLLQYVLSQASR